MDSNFTLDSDCLRQQIYFQANAFRAIAVFLVSIPLCVMTLLGNAAILITIFKTPSLHSPAHILLAGLALSDFALGFIVQPLLLSIVLSAGYNYDLSLATSDVFKLQLFGHRFVRSFSGDQYSNCVGPTTCSPLTLEIRCHSN